MSARDDYPLLAALPRGQRVSILALDQVAAVLDEIDSLRARLSAAEQDARREAENADAWAQRAQHRMNCFNRADWAGVAPCSCGLADRRSEHQAVVAARSQPAPTSAGMGLATDWRWPAPTPPWPAPTTADLSDDCTRCGEKVGPSGEKIMLDDGGLMHVQCWLDESDEAARAQPSPDSPCEGYPSDSSHPVNAAQPAPTGVMAYMSSPAASAQPAHNEPAPTGVMAYMPSPAAAAQAAHNEPAPEVVREPSIESDRTTEDVPAPQPVLDLVSALEQSVERAKADRRAARASVKEEHQP